YMKRNLVKPLAPVARMLVVGTIVHCLGMGIVLAKSQPFKVAEELVGVKYFHLAPVSDEIDITVTGTVTDETGEPIPGVTVSIPDTGIGTATDIDGKYTLTVPEGSTLVFSF